LHARIATFENRDVRASDQLIGLVRAQIAERDADTAPGRHLLLLAPTKGGALSVSFFRDEDDLRASAPVFDELETRVPESVRGRRTSVRAWEVALDELCEGGLAARMAALDVDPWRVIELVYLVRDQLATEAEELDGWRGAALLVDRESGQTRTITFWESDDALRRSEIRETQLRIRVAAEIGATIARADRYAVAVDAVPAAA
jgi:hypothetical protein